MIKKLREILALLKEINAQVERWANLTDLLVTQVTRLREAHDTEDLPEDMPYRDKFTKAGITSLHMVPRTASSLRKIEGIGWDEVVDISNYLKARKNP